ncbi:MAG TPA: HD domain-containing phosphohydrolase [Candidatus Saccharimonadales bacterium]|jgi:HD-GYP domain-containing protein (c-di-GMP phosphodiesterase class II)|nr:HD domain-containing phosphohydrolase [Candidatus Saccharimonadales bacterium]
MRIPLPSRIPILYLVLLVLVAVGVIPLYFYAAKVLQMNREALTRNERLMQNTVTSTLAQDISQRQRSVQSMLSNLTYSVQAISGGDLEGNRVEDPEVKNLLKNSTDQPDSIVPFAVLANRQGHASYAGQNELADDFLKKELERGMAAAQDGRSYSGDPVSIGNAKDYRTVMVMASPVVKNGATYLGTLELIVDLRYVVKKLKDAKSQGLETFVVDHSGRLVASANPKFATGLDMRNNEMVKIFVEQSSNARLTVTKEFMLGEGKNQTPMLGTYDPVPGLGWAVVAQKPRTDAYRDAIEMQRTGVSFAMLAIGISILIAVFFARRLTTPLQVLTESSRAIAGGDFTQRVHVKSLTEIGELAQTFNSMTDDLEQFVFDLRKAAEENKTLFLSSIQMLAGAVDEKDPYTKGHSDRVTRYSVIIATELGLGAEDIEKIRISAQLHDVGKIGIEDRILKKPGALTPEEFEIMKTHTTKGAAILRPVEMLREMLPGIELHHESLDGRGYPFGLKGDQLPLMPRIIMVADTFDAMTTNRPYQAAMDPEYVIRIINSLAATKFDPHVVAAMTRVFEMGKLRLHRAATVSAEQATAAGVVSI